jgi:hypothetical protein
MHKIAIADFKISLKIFTLNNDCVYLMVYRTLKTKERGFIFDGGVVPKQTPVTA